jgi:hypothetical protein
MAEGKNREESAYCRAFRHGLDGHVFQEKRNGRTAWVAYLECKDCGSRRIDVMEPNTCQLLGRSYTHEDWYDTTLSPQDAKQIVFARMLTLAAGR